MILRFTMFLCEMRMRRRNLPVQVAWNSRFADYHIGTREWAGLVKQIWLHLLGAVAITFPSRL